MSQRGFTLLELVSVAAIMGILVLALSSFYVNNLIDGNVSFTRATIQQNTKLAADVMAAELKLAKGVLSNNANPDNNAPGAPGNLYSWASGASTLVLAVPAKNSAGSFIYTDANHSGVKTNDVIYFISGGKLYRRLIANPDPNNVAKTTCPPALATSACPADKTIVEATASLAVLYYIAGGTAASSPNLATLVNVTVTQSKQSGAKTYSNSITTQAKLRNK